MRKFIDQLFGASQIAIIGGGRFCKEILEVLLDGVFSDNGIHILGVYDANEDAVGRRYAKKRGISTTSNLIDIF